MSLSEFDSITVIGCGRWGGFLGYYTATYKSKKVLMYGLEIDPAFQSLKTYGKNDYVTMPDNVSVTSDLNTALKNNVIIISIGCQNLRSLCRELNQFDLSGKKFLLAMKGLEQDTGKRLTQVFREEIPQENVGVAVLLGPGHVQDYLQKIPSCVVIDSDDEQVKRDFANYMNSDLIRAYYGTDLIGNEIGGALKNVIGLAAGILDGLNWHGLKGALMARAPVEVGRIIAHFGGDPKTAYGLAHLGDYEATLFSAHSHNRQFGESLVKGPRFEKLAEGVYTLKAVYALCDQLDLPICKMLYETVYDGKDPKSQIARLYERPTKSEF